MHFCKPVKRRATEKKSFKIVGDFAKGKSIKLSDCVGACMGAARVMVGNTYIRTAGLNQQCQSR
jgi:hypothetical protein